MGKLLKLKPSFHVRVEGPVDIEIVRVNGKWVYLNIECAKGTNIKWGTTRKVGKIGSTDTGRSKDSRTKRAGDTEASEE